MKRALVLVTLLTATSASAQLTGDASALRRALKIDPFAVAPYRLLATGLRPTDRRTLLDELSHSGQFADQVLAARLDLDGGQAAAARGAVHTAIAVLPLDARSLDAFCQLALSSGAFADAAVAAERALERGRTPGRLVTAAIAELRQGKQKEGLALITEARGKDPSGGATDAALDTLLGQHMTEEAVALLRAQLDDGSGKPRGTGNAAQWRRLADLERQLGRFDATSDALLHVLDLETTPTGRRSAAQSVLRLYRERSRLHELAKLLKGAHTAPRLVLRGDLEAELGHAQTATASYEAASKLDPTDPEAQLHLAASAKSPAERANRYEALVAAHPGELRFALELADLRFSSKEDAAGKRVLREAGVRFATSPAAQDQIARRLAEHKAFDDALVCRRRAAELDSHNVDYALALAEALTASKQPSAAIAAYTDAITRGGAGRAAYDRVIDGMERSGYDEAADAKFVEARAKWPGDLALLRRHAAALERRRQYKRALVAWEEAKQKVTRPFEKEQADYNIRRLQDLILSTR
jgi:hypothetical protein